MDMSMGTSMFQDTNMALARAYWYAVAGVVGLCVVVRAVNAYDTRVRLHAHAARARAHPTQPQNAFLQAWATLTAVARELAYPQLALPAAVPAWLTPPPAGRVLLLLAYWTLVIAFMTAGAVVHDVNFYERIGFRNAWVAVTQLPLLYLLAGKVSVLAHLVGTSHERLNWLHRWVARTMFVTASVHGWHFYREYSKAGLTSLFFEMMPMGRYGVAAWALLLWSCVSGLAPLRRLGYEVFVLQHIATAVVLLWVVYKHVPAYARYNVWFAIAALGFDRAARAALLLWQNVRLRRPDGSRCTGGQRLGHQAQLRVVGDAITVVTIKDVHFRWRAGQHLYLWMPSVGPFEQHPYTIACAHQLPATCICNSIQLVVRRHDGFSRRMHAAAVRMEAAAASNTLGNGPSCAPSNPTVTVFVTGPFGDPVRWDVYETLVLVSASTGASFTLPILESVLQMAGRAPHTLCTKRVDFLLAATTGDEIDYYVERLHELVDEAQAVGIELTVVVAVTRERGREDDVGNVVEIVPSSVVSDEAEKQASSTAVNNTGKASSSTASSPSRRSKSSSSGSSSNDDVEKTAAAPRRTAAAAAAAAATATGAPPRPIRRLCTRPDVGAFVRTAVEATGGETSVVVCGGPSLVAQTRNCVARLSNERAVHKGTGAQGIHLHVEEYAF